LPKYTFLESVEAVFDNRCPALKFPECLRIFGGYCIETPVGTPDEEAPVIDAWRGIDGAGGQKRPELDPVACIQAIEFVIAGAKVDNSVPQQKAREKMAFSVG
jgi:hypothetical protein